MKLWVRVLIGAGACVLANFVIHGTHVATGIEFARFIIAAVILMVAGGIMALDFGGEA